MRAHRTRFTNRTRKSRTAALRSLPAEFSGADWAKLGRRILAEAMRRALQAQAEREGHRFGVDDKEPKA
ncbi:MAG: hypothetical protein HZB38_13735 [Planctomycetes bacterium]|nr:hypothetical protein [Planctomycetota bacterium]